MCRNIKRLRRPEPKVTQEEIEACALHLVKKISGYQKPSQKNQNTFFKAVSEITKESSKLLSTIEVAGERTCVET